MMPYKRSSHWGAAHYWQRLISKSVMKRGILSLELLQHAAKVVRPGRTFVSRMYSVVASVQKLDYFTRLNGEFRSDIYWWHIFLKEWNGVSFLQRLHPTLPSKLMHRDLGDVLASSAVNGSNCSGPQNGSKRQSWQKCWFLLL